MKKDSRPNIIIIITDQQTYSAMGCAGNEYIKTPAMDSLAENGVRFTNAYTPNPVCVPARVSLFTGRWPHEAGILSNTNKAPLLLTDEFTWLGRLTEDAGYRNIYFGKWHLASNHGDEKVRKKTGFSEGFMMNADNLLADACEDFLEEWDEEGRKKPFFMVLSFINPHNICQFARRQPLPNGDIGEPPAASECPPLPPNFDIQEKEPDVLRQVQESNRKKLYPTKKWTDEEWRQYLWAHNRMVELVDKEMVRIMDSIKATGIEENTVIIFTSDHGEGLASHHWNQKQILYENPTHVPLIIQYKAAGMKGETCSELVSSGFDIFATVCDYAGADLPEKARGLSLRGLIENNGTLNRESVGSETQFVVNDLGVYMNFSEIELPFEQPQGRMVRTRDFKYMVYKPGELREQLFDMRTDPHEMHNLALDPNYNDVLQHHRALIAERCRETYDEFDYIA